MTGRDGVHADSWKYLRLVMWGGAALLLSLPLVAMQFTREVDWDATDFSIIGVMLLIACGTCELGAKMSRNVWYRIAVGIAVAAGFILVWVNLAVGIIGAEHERANLLFAGVLLVGGIGAVVARLRAGGMARALVATAVAQALVGVFALILGHAYVLVITAFFVVLWLASAALFDRAAREQSPGSATPVA